LRDKRRRHQKETEEAFSDDIVKPLTPARRAALAEFLNRPDRPEGSLTIGEVEGFLFTVAACPDLVPPSEWLPIVFGGELPQFEDREEAELVVGGLLALYNVINEDVREFGGRLPGQVKPRGKPADNMDQDAPIAQWSSGFVEGHLWLEDVWTAYGNRWKAQLQQGMEGLERACWVLGLFSAGSFPEFVLKESGADKRTREAVIKNACDNFAWSASIYVMIGKRMGDLQRQSERGRPAKDGFIRPGRNDPCTCGSLKKYKKCCGRPARA